MPTPNYDFESPNLVPILPNATGQPAFSSQTPNLRAELCAMIEIRDVAFRAYIKALKAGKQYTAEGMQVTRYDLDSLKKHYIDARDAVDMLLATGNLSTMRYRRIIPLDR